MVNIKIVNLVITTDLKQKLPLELLTARLPNVEYNPEQFPGLVMRIKKPKTSFLLFNSGKIVCSGNKSISDAKKAIHQLIDELNKVNIKITTKPQLKIQNQVGTAELGFNLDLNKLMMQLQNTEYEPKLFPGLIYKINHPSYANFLLFSNGKVVCTGTKNKKMIEKCFEQLVNDLKSNMPHGQ